MQIKMEITMDDVIYDLSMLKPVVINEKGLNARIYYIPVIKDGKVFIGYYTNRTLIHDEYGFARVSVLNPNKVPENNPAMLPLIKRRQEEYDTEIISIVKEVMYKKLNLYSNHFIEKGAYLTYMENWQT